MQSRKFLPVRVLIAALLFLACCYNPLNALTTPTTGVIATGSTHAIALKNAGTVWTWGLNDYGQLGDGTTEENLLPTQISSLTGIVAVAAGENHNLVLKSDGTVWDWGLNDYGQLGDGTTTTRTAPVVLSSLSGMTALAAGTSHSLSIKSDETVWAWGKNDSGQLGDGTTTTSMTPVQSGSLSDILDIAAGEEHSLALADGGTVWAWGQNTYGQLGDGTTTNKTSPTEVTTVSGITKITAGAFHSLALKSDGTVWGWGLNTYGQLGDGTTTTQTTPVQVSGLTGVTSIAAGSDHSLALTSAGAVWSWGLNDEGQLGDGTTTNRSTPSQISELSDVVAIAASDKHSMALLNDGTILTWGDDEWGEVGDVSLHFTQAAIRLITWASDSNQNGMEDAWEVTYFGDLSHTGLGDTDSDGLADILEYELGTDPTLTDSDGDGIGDLAECDAGTDPADYYNGTLPTITSLVDSSGVPGVDGLVSVKITNGDGSALANAPVTFSVSIGTSEIASSVGGTASTTVTVRTSSSGVAAAYVTFTSLAVDILTASVTSGDSSTSISIDIEPPASDIDGLLLWLKADAGVTKDSSGYVSLWADQSGNGHDVSQSTSGKLPLWVEDATNGQPVIRFDGTDFFTGVTTSDFKPTNITVLAVYKQSTASTRPKLISQPMASSGWTTPWMSWDLTAGMGSSSSKPGSYITVGSTVYTNTSVLSFLSEYISLALTYNGTESNLYINGSKRITSAVSGVLAYGTSSTFYIGADPYGEYLKGDIAEILVYDRALTESELEVIGKYSYHKYALLGYGDSYFIKTLTGTDSGETLAGTDGYSNIINGLGGNDYLYGGNIADTLIGGAGNDNLYGYAGDDTLSGGDSVDAIVGGAGSDVIDGGAGNDVIGGYYAYESSANSSSTDASAGDTITGGLGDDSIYGTRGPDVYVYNLGDGADRITEAGNSADSGIEDELRFGEGITPASVVVTQKSGGLVFTLNDGGSVTVVYWYSDARYQIEKVTFSDGITWLAADLTTRGLTYNGTDSADTYTGVSGYNNIINGGNGNDKLYGSSLADTLNGGDGDDTLNGYAGDDTLNGDAGNDTMDGGAGNDVLYGGNGVDTISGNAGSDIIDGGAGNDTIGGHYASLASNNASESSASAGDTLIGGLGDDTIYGTRGPDVYLYALGDGSDTIREYGNSADIGVEDELRFGEGITPESVTVTQSSGGLVLTLSDGGSVKVVSWYTGATYQIEEVTFNDGTVWLAADLTTRGLTYNGTENADTYTGVSDYNNTIDGASGNDYLYGGNLSDTLNGGDGDDTLKGYGGDDTLNGNAGDDSMLAGGAGDDIINGGDGDDNLYGEGGDDTLNGDAGKDRLDGGAGDDELNGGDGADTISGGAGSDIIDGGAGDDFIGGYWAGNYSQNSSDSDANAGDMITGGLGDDMIYGTRGPDVYIYNFGDGVDTIIECGNSADSGIEDELLFGDGITPESVTVTQSGGNLFFTLSDGGSIRVMSWYSAATYQIEKATFSDGAEWLVTDLTSEGLTYTGTEGADTYTGASGYNNIISGLVGNDKLYGGSLADTLEGGDGDDVMYGYAGDDTLNGDAGNDALDGGAGADILNGGDGVDTISGGAGSDIIDGGAGNDTLGGYNASASSTNSSSTDASAGDTITGGLGDDMIYGTRAPDVYVYDLGDGADTITEFGNSADSGIEDELRFGDGISADGVSVTQKNGGLVFTLSDGGSVIIASWYGAETKQIENVTFSDGVTWTTEMLVSKATELLTVHGSDSSDTLTGVDNNTNTLYGGAGNDIVSGGNSDDYLYGESGNDNLYGNDGSDILDGGEGSDTLSGGKGSDTLNGGVGNDTLYGYRNGTTDEGTNTGNTFTGGLGDDKLYGTRGPDTYIYNLGDGEDTILEAGNSDDTGIVDEILFNVGITPDSVRVTRESYDIIFTLDDGGSVSVLKWFALDKYQIEKIVFVDGTEWIPSDFAYLATNSAAYIDTDGDGLTDAEEQTLGTDGYITDPLVDDTDGDGIDDSTEAFFKIDPTKDSLAMDSDGDGLYDSEEISAGLDGYITDPNEADTDGDGLSDYDECKIYYSNPLVADTDGDGLSDCEEVTAGIDGYITYFEIWDTDGDGISDGKEYATGLNPTSNDSGKDTDGDGIDDIDEVLIFGTNPNVDNDYGTQSVVQNITLSAYTVETGTWTSEDSNIVARTSNGSLSYTLNMTESGIYILEVDGGQHNSFNTGSYSFLLNIYVDGSYVGDCSLSSSDGSDDNAHMVLPKLTSGNHTLKIECVGSSTNSFLKLTGAKLVSYSGTDTDGDGVADWIEERIDSSSSLDTATVYTAISPYTIEGESKYPDEITIESTYTPETTDDDDLVAKRGLIGTYYANIPLSPDEATTITVNEQSGASTYNKEINWIAYNILDNVDTKVRLNDSLKLAAYDSNSCSTDAVSVKIYNKTTNALVASHTQTAADGWTYKFEAIGSYEIVGTCTENGTNVTQTIEVNVLSVDFGNTPAAIVNSARTWVFDCTSSFIHVEADSTIVLSHEIQTTTQRSYSLKATSTTDATLVARLGVNGPIMDSAAVSPFNVESSSAGNWSIVDILDDGSQLVEVTINLSEVPDDLVVTMTMAYGSATYLNGTKTMTITAADFSDDGTYKYYLVLPAGAGTHACHNTYFMLGNSVIAIY